jgi:protoporphyrin/coproporphyrin ferrochelatase
MNDNKNAKRGIVLMNLGSPASTAVPDVKRYLNEFLMDERVIDYPYVFRSLLVKGIIVPNRAAKSAEAYSKVWTDEGSPLVVLTDALRGALQQLTTDPIETSMRYGAPHTKTAFDTLVRRAPRLEEVVLVPLYPHYAMSSYETALEHAKDAYAKHNYNFRLTVVPPFYNDGDYIDALTESMKPYVTKPFDQLLFSYHGLPERHMRKADVTGKHCMRSPDCCSVDSVAHRTCYRHQCFTTTKLVVDKLGLDKSQYGLSFQSRLGAESWLKPYTAERLTQLPKEGVKRLLIACPAFVSDCLETLEEIAMAGKETFLQAGGESFEMIPCMNTHPRWVSALKNLIDKASAAQRVVA